MGQVSNMGKIYAQKEVFVLTIFILLLVLFFYKVFFFDATFFSRDISQYYRPVKFLAVESIQRGVFPFWNPYLSGGLPFLATVQHGLFYPLTLLLYFFPFEYGFKYSIIFHFLIAGVGLYLLLRYWRFSYRTGLLVVLIYTFGGVNVSLINLLTSLQSLAWVGFVLLFFQRALAQSRWFIGSLLLSLVLILQFFAGQPEIMYMSFLVLFLLGWFYKAVSKFRFVGILLVAMLLVFFLSFVQIIPFAELLKWSAREFNSQNYSVNWYLSVKQLLGVIGLGGGGNQQGWLKSVYLGFIPIIFSLIGLSQVRTDKTGKVCGFMAVLFVTLLLSFGKQTFMYSLVNEVVPGMRMIRYPVKFYLLTNLFLAILAGYGWQRIEGRFKNSLVKTLVITVIFISGIFYTVKLEPYIFSSLPKGEGAFFDIIKTLGNHRYGFTPWTYAQVTKSSSGQIQKEASVIDDSSRWAMLPNMSMVNHCLVLKGYESINLRRFEDFYGLLSLQTTPSASALLDIMNVKYLVSLKTLSDQDLILIKDQGWKIYEKKNIIPRAFLTTENVREYDNLPAMMGKLKASFTFIKPAEIKNYDLNKVSLNVLSPISATLVLTDIYYPGWGAYVDGKKKKVFSAYYLFRAVSLSRGEHEIIFRYVPNFFIMSLAVTIVAWLFSLYYLAREVKQCEC